MTSTESESTRLAALESAVLGQTRTLFELNAQQQNMDAVVALIAQAKQQIRIFTPALNPLLFDTDMVINAVQSFALRSHRSELQILVHDSRTLTQHPHRILELGHRLGSRIELRKTHADFNQRLDEFMLVDDCGLFKLPNAEHYAALCCFMDPRQVNTLGSFFDQAWDHSQIDHELRQQLI